MTKTRLVIAFSVLGLMACGGGDDGGAADAPAGADGAAGGDGGGTLADAPGGDCEAVTAPLPTTTMTVDGVSYYRVFDGVNAVPSAFVKQVNFGTEAQFRTCPDEPGQNATFTIVMTFATKPEASGSLDYTSSRGATEGAVSFYLNFLNNTGHARMNKQYLTPDAGTFDFTITGDTLTAAITDLTMTNEVDGADSFVLEGDLDLAGW